MILIDDGQTLKNLLNLFYLGTNTFFYRRRMKPYNSEVDVHVFRRKVCLELVAPSLPFTFLKKKVERQALLCRQTLRS